MGFKSLASGLDTKFSFCFMIIIFILLMTKHTTQKSQANNTTNHVTHEENNTRDSEYGMEDKAKAKGEVGIKTGDKKHLEDNHKLHTLINASQQFTKAQSQHNSEQTGVVTQTAIAIPILQPSQRGSISKTMYETLDTNTVATISTLSTSRKMHPAFVTSIHSNVENVKTANTIHQLHNSLISKSPSYPSIDATVKTDRLRHSFSSIASSSSETYPKSPQKSSQSTVRTSSILLSQSVKVCSGKICSPTTSRNVTPQNLSEIVVPRKSITYSTTGILTSKTLSSAENTELFVNGEKTATFSLMSSFTSSVEIVSIFSTTELKLGKTPSMMQISATESSNATNSAFMQPVSSVIRSPITSKGSSSKNTSLTVPVSHTSLVNSMNSSNKPVSRYSRLTQLSPSMIQYPFKVTSSFESTSLLESNSLYLSQEALYHSSMKKKTDSFQLPSLSRTSYSTSPSIKLFNQSAVGYLNSSAHYDSSSQVTTSIMITLITMTSNTTEQYTPHSLVQRSPSGQTETASANMSSRILPNNMTSSVQYALSSRTLSLMKTINSSKMATPSPSTEISKFVVSTQNGTLTKLPVQPVVSTGIISSTRSSSPIRKSVITVAKETRISSSPFTTFSGRSIAIVLNISHHVSGSSLHVISVSNSIAFSRSVKLKTTIRRSDLNSSVSNHSKIMILKSYSSSSPRKYGISSSNVISKPNTRTVTYVPSTKAPLLHMQTELLSRSKTTIVTQLDLSHFNLQKALKVDIIIQRYGPDTVDFDGITALPPVTWFQVHYIGKYSYRRYVASSICIARMHCNRGYKSSFGFRSRQRRQLRNGLLVFRAGEEKGCENQQGRSDYCNGPLEPDTMYRFQILIHYTDSSHIATTPFSKPMTTIASVSGPVEPTKKPKSSFNQTTLIIGIIVVLIILLLIVLALVAISRKRHGRQGPYGHNGELKCALISTFRTHSNCSCTQAGGVEQGFQLSPITKGMSRPVSVKDFHAWVMRSSADSDFRFAEEFESIRDVGRDQSHEASDMPENRGKNRYVNVLAYDHTRVKLSYTDDEAGSDYINGNYIHGYQQPRAYIATQGPLPGTTDDFWRMVWEQNSYLIVMITQVTERTRVKCHRYWPSAEPTTYGDITVSLLSDYSFPNWCERELLIDVEGEEPRRIHQFQYNSWPDHGVPKTTSDILEFQSTVQSHYLSSHGPIIVHCSAGVGRTGTFIAIDTIIKRLQEEAVVDIYGTVCLMRLQRCSMVQTEDQYIYIHRAVLEYIRQREMNTHIFKGYSLLPLEERDLLDSDRGSEDASLAPTSPLVGENSI